MWAVAGGDGGEGLLVSWLQKETRNEVTQTPRLRAPVGTPMETGVRIPDGRKPEAGEGAGPGSVGVTWNQVARMTQRETKDT